MGSNAALPVDRADLDGTSGVTTTRSRSQRQVPSSFGVEQASVELAVEIEPDMDLR
jgi:hypothetical protein